MWDQYWPISKIALGQHHLPTLEQCKLAIWDINLVNYKVEPRLGYPVHSISSLGLYVNKMQRVAIPMSSLFIY